MPIAYSKIISQTVQVDGRIAITGARNSSIKQ